MPFDYDSVRLIPPSEPSPSPSGLLLLLLDSLLPHKVAFIVPAIHGFSTFPRERPDIAFIIKHPITSSRIHSVHISAFHRQRRDESQHIAGLLQGGELPVVAVATNAHSPGDEGTRHTIWT